MFTQRKPLVLASASPRRREFLKSLDLTFEIEPAELDEEGYTAENVGALVEILALEKAQVVANQFPDAYVIGADTLVAQAGEPLGKPRDEQHALEMLRKLNGVSHEVWGGLAIVCTGDDVCWSVKSCTQVTMRAVSDRFLRGYLASGEWQDKAGAYGIQGRAAAWVAAIEGSYANVVGLDISALVAQLLDLGVLDVR